MNEAAGGPVNISYWKTKKVKNKEEIIMKKMAAIIAAVLMLFGAAFAETPDLKTMSIEELLDLRRMIDSEIESRLPETPIIGAGTYIVGRDIKAGSYKLTCDENFNGYAAGVEVYDADNQEVFDSSIGAGGVVTITVRDGETLKIYYSFFYISPYTAPWMP